MTIVKIEGLIQRGKLFDAELALRELDITPIVKRIVSGAIFEASLKKAVLIKVNISRREKEEGARRQFHNLFK